MNELNELQQAVTSDITGNVQREIIDQLSGVLMAFVIPLLIITSLIAVLYILRIVHRHKVDKAIFEIRDTLREIKAAQTTTPPTRQPEPTNNTNSTTSQVD